MNINEAMMLKEKAEEEITEILHDLEVKTMCIVGDTVGIIRGNYPPEIDMVKIQLSIPDN